LNYKEKDIKWVKFEEMMGGTWFNNCAYKFVLKFIFKQGL
jgi:hypothetical protein